MANIIRLPTASDVGLYDAGIDLCIRLLEFELENLLLSLGHNGLTEDTRDLAASLDGLEVGYAADAASLRIAISFLRSLKDGTTRSGVEGS